MCKTLAIWLVALSLLAARVGVARLVAIASEAPFDKVDARVESWIKAHPKDANGYCALGKIHALGWAYGDAIPIVGDRPDTLPAFSESFTVQVMRTGSGEMRIRDGKLIQGEVREERPVSAEDAKHLAASVAAYRKAIELDPNDAVSELGLGWMLAQEGKYARELSADYWEDGKPTDAEKAGWAAAVKQLGDDDARVRDAGSKALLSAMPRCARMLREIKTDDPEVAARIDAVVQDHDDLEALGHCRRAFDLQAKADLAGQPTYQADSQISERAGAEIVRLLAAHPEAARKGEVKGVEDVVIPLAEKKQVLERGPQ